MALWNDLLGTVSSYFRIGISGPRLKNNSGALAVRNAGDTADAAVTASQVNVSGDQIVVNSDAAGSGADWTYTLKRPSTGMSASVSLTLPVDDGTASQVLSTDGNGVLSWISAAGTSDLTHVDTTTLAHNSSATLAMFTLPANAVVEAVEVIVDTAFNGTPTMTVGVSGTLAKYLGSTDCDLTSVAGTRFRVHPTVAANASTESLIVTYSQGSASAGSARVLVYYSTPA